METNAYPRSREAEDPHGWDAGLHDLALRWVRREAARVQHPLAILDAGCGTGRLGQLMQAFGTVTGCDLQPLSAPPRRGNRRELHHGLATTGAGVAAYDLITCLDVLAHHTVADAAAILLNLQRALKRDGLLLVHVGDFTSMHETQAMAAAAKPRYGRRDLARLLQATGLKIEFISYRLPLGLIPALRCPGRPASARPCSARMHRWLTHAAQLENRLLLAGWRTPFGTALFASARKKEQPGFLATGRLPQSGPVPPPHSRTLDIQGAPDM